MRRLLITGATVVMGLTGSLGISAVSSTHVAAATSSPTWRCDWDRGCDHRDRCDWDCWDRDHHHHRDRCDWNWDCRGWW
jgi:hypothetical protein